MLLLIFTHSHLTEADLLSMSYLRTSRGNFEKLMCDSYWPKFANNMHLSMLCPTTPSQVIMGRFDFLNSVYLHACGA